MLVEVNAFLEGVGQLKRKFRVEGNIVHQPLLLQNTRMITRSCVLKYRQYVLSFRQKARV